LLQAPYGHEGAGWGPVLAGVGCAQCGCALCATYRAADVSGVGEVTGAWWRFGFGELISRGRSWRRLGSPRCAGFESLGVFWRAASYQRVAWGDRVALRFCFHPGTARFVRWITFIMHQASFCIRIVLTRVLGCCWAVGTRDSCACCCATHERFRGVLVSVLCLSSI
jgi:hypothetical protein